MYFSFLEMLVKTVTFPITLKKKKTKQNKNKKKQKTGEVRKIMETLSSHD